MLFCLENQAKILNEMNGTRSLAHNISYIFTVTYWPLAIKDRLPKVFNVNPGCFIKFNTV